MAFAQNLSPATSVVVTSVFQRIGSKKARRPQFCCSSQAIRPRPGSADAHLLRKLGPERRQLIFYTVKNGTIVTNYEGLLFDLTNDMSSARSLRQMLRLSVIVAFEHDNRRRYPDEFRQQIPFLSNNGIKPSVNRIQRC